MKDKVCISKTFVYLTLFIGFLVGLIYFLSYINSSKKVLNSKAEGITSIPNQLAPSPSPCSRRYDYLDIYDNKIHKAKTSNIKSNTCEYRVRAYDKIGVGTAYENALTGYTCENGQFVKSKKCTPFYYGQRDIRGQKLQCYLELLGTYETNIYCKKADVNSVGDIKIGSLFYGYDNEDQNVPIYQKDSSNKKTFINWHFDIAKEPKTIEGLPGYAATRMTYVSPTLMPTFSITPASTVVQPTPLPTMAVYNSKNKCIDNSSLIQINTEPNLSSFEPADTIKITFRIANSGDCTWNTSYSLVYLAGDRLNIISVPLSVKVLPSNYVNLALGLLAPPSPGEYSSKYQLKNDSGFLFGEIFEAKIKVDLSPIEVRNCLVQGEKVYYGFYYDNGEYFISNLKKDDYFILKADTDSVISKQKDKDTIIRKVLTDKDSIIQDTSAFRNFYNDGGWAWCEPQSAGFASQVDWKFFQYLNQ